MKKVPFSSLKLTIYCHVAVKQHPSADKFVHIFLRNQLKGDKNGSFLNGIGMMNKIQGHLHCLLPLGIGVLVHGGIQTSVLNGFKCVIKDRKSVVSGKSVSVRVDIGGRRIITKKKKNK